jgi:hypothetical protein
MSYGREVLEEMWIEELVEEQFIEKLLKNKEWQIKSGEILKIKDMETSHITNCINLIVKSEYKWRERFLNNLKKELEER